jgi:hypothetical protein
MAFAPATEDSGTTAEGSRLSSEGLPSSVEGAETSREAWRTVRQSPVDNVPGTSPLANRDWPYQ